MAKRIGFWTVWMALAVAWCAYVWFAWYLRPGWEYSDAWSYVISAAGFILPPGIFALIGLAVRSVLQRRPA